MLTLRKLRELAIAAAVAVAFVAISTLTPFEKFHLLDVDVLHALHNAVVPSPATDVPSPVTVIGIDEATHVTPPFAGIPKVMWTPQIARVQDAVLAAGAKVMGWDLILPTSAASYVADKGFDTPLLTSFATGRAEGRIILGTADIGDTRIEPHKLFSWTVGGAANLRSLNVSPDQDGVVRRIATFFTVEKKDGKRMIESSMALEMTARATGAEPSQTEGGGLQLGAERSPGVRDNKVLLNFTGAAKTVPTFSLADLHACATQDRTEFFTRHFKDKIVVFGLVLDVEDRKLSSNRLYTKGGPIGPIIRCPDEAALPSPTTLPRATVPGVYLLAVAVSNLLTGHGLATYPWAQRTALALPFALLAAAATMTLGLATALLATLAGALVWLAMSLYMFDQGTVLPLIVPLLAGLAAFFATLAIRFLILDQQGRFLRRAFSSYVSPALVARLVEDPDQLKLGGERREMTFLFTDLADFTPMIEKLDPEEAASLLNTYLEGMIEIAKDNGGTIDKVIGDAVVVLFAAPVYQPDHAEQALACALAMDAFATAFSAEQRARGIRVGVTRIGVHSGTAIIGNFGGRGFFDYTALGDAVNTAARLESVNKHLGTRIAMSGETTRRCKVFEGRPVGSLILKGKERGIDVFEPVSAGEPCEELRARYGEAFARMAQGHADAASAFAKLAADYPDDPLTRLHLKRLARGETGDVIKLDEK